MDKLFDAENPFRLNEADLAQAKNLGMGIEAATRRAIDSVLSKQEEIVLNAVEQKLGYRPRLREILPRLSVQKIGIFIYVSLDDEEIVLFTGLDEPRALTRLDEPLKLGFRYHYLVDDCIDK